MSLSRGQKIVIVFPSAEKQFSVAVLELDTLAVVLGSDLRLASYHVVHLTCLPWRRPFPVQTLRTPLWH